MTVRIWQLGRLKPAISASKRALSKRAHVCSVRFSAWARKSMKAVPEFKRRSPSRFSNLVLKNRM
eukprot:6821292-Pyramimonas_sp.AAC.1